MAGADPAAESIKLSQPDPVGGRDADGGAGSDDVPAGGADCGRDGGGGTCARPPTFGADGRVSCGVSTWALGLTGACGYAVGGPLHCGADEVGATEAGALPAAAEDVGALDGVSGTSSTNGRSTIGTEALATATVGACFVNVGGAGFGSGCDGCPDAAGPLDVGADGSAGRIVVGAGVDGSFDAGGSYVVAGTKAAGDDAAAAEDTGDSGTAGVSVGPYKSKGSLIGVTRARPDTDVRGGATSVGGGTTGPDRAAPKA